MSRNIDDISTGDFSFPEAGKHGCKCMGWKKVLAKNSGNSGIELRWATHDGESSFTDTLWLTPKAIGRLALVAKKLCEGARELELDDDDSKAIWQLAELIEETIEGVNAIVEIVAYKETFIHESGDKIGQKETRDKKRVAFAGYERDEAEDVF